MATVDLREASVAGRDIRYDDVLIGFDPSEKDASASARTDTLLEVSRKVYARPPDDLTDVETAALRKALVIPAPGSGPKGDKGDPSMVPGPKGDPGPASLVAGPKGDPGPASVVPGPKGNPGPASLVPGPKGDPGPASVVPGPKGNPGPASLVPGPKGDPGPASVVPGPKGNPGPASLVPGPKGDPGPASLVAGPKGDPGPVSVVPGPKGDPGPASLVAGPKGDPGAVSVVPGPKGVKGDKGDKGDKGNPGAQGIPGTSTSTPGTTPGASGYVFEELFTVTLESRLGRRTWTTLKDGVRELVAADDDGILEFIISIGGAATSSITVVETIPVGIFRLKGFNTQGIASSSSAKPCIVFKTVNPSIGNVSAFGHANLFVARNTATEWRWAWSHDLPDDTVVTVRIRKIG